MLGESLQCKELDTGNPHYKEEEIIKLSFDLKMIQIYRIARKRLSRLNLCYLEELMDQIVEIFLLPITVVIVCSGRCKETM